MWLTIIEVYYNCYYVLYNEVIKLTVMLERQIVAAIIFTGKNKTKLISIENNVTEGPAIYYHQGWGLIVLRYLSRLLPYTENIFGVF